MADESLGTLERQSEINTGSATFEKSNSYVSEIIITIFHRTKQAGS